MHKHKLIARLAFYAVIFCLLVMAMGAYTRLKNAGLGCPDWPLCYGHLLVPHANMLDKLQASHLNSSKAWAEMIHRYLAGTLGFIILFIMGLSMVQAWRHQHASSLFLPGILLLTVVYQAVLGMWTVTLKLLPVIVSQHLLGGMTLLGCLWLLGLTRSNRQWLPYNARWRIYCPWLLVGLLLLIIQIALGAWTSTNYAAISCGAFPFCEVHQWLPHWDFYHGFNLHLSIGPNYEGGLLKDNARKTIQMVHRMGALTVSVYWLLLVMVLNVSSVASSRLLAYTFLILFMLMVQFGLGILNVLLGHPLWLAVAHNTGAALLLLCIILINFAAHQASLTFNEGACRV
jgi:cytochrome c oxidase assembly protein subunit 15